MIEIKDRKKGSLHDLVDCMEDTLEKMRHRLEEQSSEEDGRHHSRRYGRYDEDEDEDERDYGYGDEERYRRRRGSRY